MFNLRLIFKLKSTIEIIGNVRDVEVEISTDSRSLSKENLFLALSGENFDGSLFVRDVLKNGASSVVLEDNCKNRKKAKENIKKFPQVCFVFTKDTLFFLQELARARALEWTLGRERKILGITGSNGKTTTKEMIRFFLEQVFPESVCCTEGNLNNHIGVPLTILSVKDSDQVMLVEMGTNQMGEIKLLCDIARPDAGIITNVGSAHIEFFKSDENILKEKSSLYKSVMKKTKNKGVFILNFDNQYLSRLEECEQVYSFGEKQGKIKVELGKQQVIIHDADGVSVLQNENILESFNWINFTSAFLLVSKVFSGEKEKILKSAKCFRLTENNRTQRVNWKGLDVYLDAYNANPASMKASLESFIQILKNENKEISKYLFVLGDMYELGGKAHEEHRRIGELLKNAKVPNLLFIGRYSKDYENGFGPAGIVFECKKDLEKNWLDAVSGYDGLFIKGSRGLKLESLVDK